MHEHKGEISDMAADLRKKLQAEHFDRVAAGLAGYFKDFNDYGKFDSILGALVQLRCNEGCRNSRGPYCPAGKCSIKKGYKGCWECADFDGCSKLKFLEPIHGDSNRKNLSAIKEKGVEGFKQGERYW